MNKPWDVCEQVSAFKAYEAGLSMEEIMEKYQLKEVTKLASNENPLGVSKKVQGVLEQSASLAYRYPQSGNPKLVKALAAYFSKKYPHISEENIFVGNGSDEVIDLLFRVRCEPKVHNAVAFKPCFALYETQSKLHGCELRQAPLNADFTFNFDALSALVDENTRLVFVTSPDNPSGLLAPKSELIRLAKSLPPACLLVIDEAYIEFAGDEATHSLIADLQDLPNVALMRTFSKVYGLAGLRIGYGILPSQLANYLWRVRLPFSINILAQEAAVAAIEDEEFMQKTVALTMEQRPKLTEALQDMGCQTFASHSNFIMFSVPKGDQNKAKLSAKEFSVALLEKGMILRHLGAYGLPDYLRITVGTEEQNALFLSLATQILGQDGK